MKKKVFIVFMLAVAVSASVSAQPAPRELYKAECTVDGGSWGNGNNTVTIRMTKYVWAYDEENAIRKAGGTSVRARFVRWVPQAEYTAEDYNERGNAYFTNNNHDLAIAAYTQAIRLNPNYAQPYANRGVLYRDKGDNDRAIADLTQAIRLNPNNANYYYFRATAYNQRGNYAQARTDIDRTLQLNPNRNNAQNISNELRQRGY
jgi:tetratricopeptide (TPR) repeat protein